MIIHLDRDLKQRRTFGTESSPSVFDRQKDERERKPTPVRKNAILVTIISVISLLFTFLCMFPLLTTKAVHQAVDTFYTIRASVSKFVHVTDESLHGMIGEDVRLSFNLAKAADKKEAYTLGPHELKATVLKPDCKYPRIALRLKGEALVFIPLEQSGSIWSADFYVSEAGKYELDARWYGCDNFDRNASTTYTSLSLPLSFSFVGSSSESPPQLVESQTPQKIFPIGFWQCSAALPGSIKSDCVWIAVGSPVHTYYEASSALGQASLVKEGNPVSLSGLQALSNYEVVCWVGTQTAEFAREAFLSLREQLAPGQRPFKFHYNKINDLSNPELFMNVKRMTRKCKQTFVMVDELEVSQAEFKKQVISFLHGIEKCMHDPTWSIWMFTVNSMSPKACHSPVNRTSYHPCNDALFEIFDSKVLPSNVRLVDNTDISNPQMGENPKDVAATIAMRTAALIGKQVDTWRAAGQHAAKEGLFRNGVLEDDPADECHFDAPV